MAVLAHTFRIVVRLSTSRQTASAGGPQTITHYVNLPNTTLKLARSSSTSCEASQL